MGSHNSQHAKAKGVWGMPPQKIFEIQYPEFAVFGKIQAVMSAFSM